MTCIIQSRSHFKQSETFRIIKELDNILVEVEGLLNRVLPLEELPNMTDVFGVLGEVVAMRRIILAKLRQTCRVLKDFLRRVLFKMTSPRSLLEISATLVLNYHLSTDDLPKELELQLQEVKMKINNLENVKKYLEHEVSSLSSEVCSSVSEFEIACNNIFTQ